MIIRMWRGSALPDKAEAYFEHVTQMVFPKLPRIDGFIGGEVLRRELDEQVEFIVVTRWRSWKDIGAFAGEHPEIAVIEPEARAALVQFDDHVTHYELAHVHTASE